MSPTYRANWAIQLDGEALEEGDAVELTEERAGPLLAGGSISLAVDTPAAAVDAGPSDPDIRKQAIMQAIAGLDLDNPDIVTAGGLPKVEAVEAVLGWNISADERNRSATAVRAAADFT